MKDQKWFEDMEQRIPHGEVRTRFAPSPTGYMHVGNLRTALYTYLIARHAGGKFILRIEDTDQGRYVEGAVDVIYSTMRACGLTHDEGPDVGGPVGPYVQTERRGLYKEYAELLIARGHAYRCFCDKDDAHVGFYTTNHTITSFIATTGTTLIDVQPDGTITNNILSADVSRAMTFLEGLCRDGLTYDKSYGDWVSPQVFSTACNNILFTCTEPEWTYIAETENLQNKPGVDDDIFDTVSEFSFVPFPRDPVADKYYTEYDTFGYLVPKGAKNIDGAIEFINLNRMYDIDPAIQAKVREDHINPQKIYFEKGKYAGSEKWQMKWGEREYDLWREMCDPSNFTFINEDAEGFSTDFTDQIGGLLMGVVERGESWAKTSAEFSPIADGTIQPFLS